MITITIADRNGSVKPLDIPDGISLSLMEVLKAMDYPIAATCGGLALCATCHVEVLLGAELLPEPGEAELQMIDTLPDAVTDSRLSCQLRITEIMNGMIFRIMPEQ
jgi:ferredoxin